MRVLWLATKEPWPPRDGGRLVAALTLEALVAAGHEITVVAPCAADDAADAVAAARAAGVELVAVPARPRLLAVAGVRALITRRPLTVERHDLPAVRRAVARLVGERRFDVVHVEQVQAMAGARAAGALPRLLRAQNVESDLWRAAAAGAPWAPLFAREARRLAAYEGRAVAAADVAVALTAEDAARLGELAGRPVEHIPAPFAETLPAGPPLPGDPAVVLFAGGWRPNREGAAWFLREVWSRVHAASPGARLHLFGATGEGRPGVVARPAPADSRDAFAAGALLAVPLAVASGVRMKILEAWARGLPVVATPTAARGLGATDGRDLLVAAPPADLAAAILRLHRAPELATSLVAAGKRLLAERHRPSVVAERLVALYGSAARQRGDDLGRQGLT